MSVAYTITMTGQEDTNKLLADLQSRGLPLELHRRIGQSGEVVLEEHLKALDAERANPLGGKRSHFYWNAANSVTSAPTAEGAVITVDHLGLRQRWLGGEIRAINGKYLTIPARTESYGVPAREFPQPLRFIKFRSGSAALVVDESRNEDTFTIDDAGNVGTKRGKKNRRRKSAGLVQYWLVESVYQQPDPSVIPSPEQFLNAAEEAANGYFVETLQ